MLAKLRKSKKLTQRELASKLNISRTAISSYENNVVPPLDTMRKLADALEVDLNTIVNCFLHEKDQV